MNGEAKIRPSLLAGIPPFPVVAVKTLHAISNERGRLKELNELILSDPAIATRFLRMANSALFGIRGEVRSVRQAIHLLGLERVKAVVVTVAMTAYLDGSLQVPALRACWRHSLACALLAEELRRMGIIDPGIAFTAGLMHDVGRLAMVAGYPAEYANFLRRAESDPCDVLQGERELFGMDHCEAGLLLVTHWNLPEVFGSIVSLHHGPPVESESITLKIVRQGCRMADALGFCAAHSSHPPTYEEILEGFSEFDRGRLPGNGTDMTHFIAAKINSIESQ